MSDPAWLAQARKYVGMNEVPGKTTASFISKWLRQLNAWWSDDETPWCGVFVAGCLTDVGYPRPTNWFRARAYLNYGTPLTKPRVGCIAVFHGGLSRPGAGHVGFVVGEDEHGRLMVLGGNQGNAVSIAPFSRSRVLGYRWPEADAPSTRSTLPLLASNGAVSSDNEA
jgi:uncharacterized protein (TIGR02594 family)